MIKDNLFAFPSIICCKDERFGKCFAYMRRIVPNTSPSRKEETLPSAPALSAKALLDENPSPTEEEVKEAISGNLCRCTGYIDIVDAILDVSENQERKETK